ncbi:MAG: succinylglutamate desuccinylase/aspartoacylase family protein [Methanobacteriaceae archaeon]|nr:succinylglutamate desuccinylase/aspartoacylase family protein [Methanobacteriaceae archaeon]
MDLSKIGTPYIKLGNGNGSTIIITSGVHGSELSPQAATIKLINKLYNKIIYGTIYIFPFVAPNITSKNIRLYKKRNLNKIANIKNSLTNNIINFAIEKNVNGLGDFHSTKPNDNPGQTIVMGSYKPLIESATITNYISKEVNCAKIIYDQAATEYLGALEDACNVTNIPSVTCEVLCPHGIIEEEAIDTSYKQMLSFIKYFNI